MGAAPVQPDDLAVQVVVIGAGMSGIYMAKQLSDRRIPYVILEKADEVGGTWRDNKYPGLSVDLSSLAYQLPFAPKYDFSCAYPVGSELQEYLVHTTEEHGIRGHIRFGVEVIKAEWAGDRWVLTTADGEHIVAPVVVAATGFLHRPNQITVPGFQSFDGPSFHSSQWPDGLAVAGKRIGVIGSGSSGTQLIACLPYLGAEVTQIVRTPQWIETNRNPELSEQARARLVADPSCGPQVLAELIEQINQDPRLRDQYWKLTPGALRDGASEALREDVGAIVDPELRAKLTPDYPPGCRRIPKSPRYYEAVQLPNVHIVRGAVEQVLPGGVIVTGGQYHEFDVLVWAIGFQAHAYVRPMQVIGTEQATLDDVWANGPFSYRGVAVPGFPNFFLLHGPFSPVNNVPVPATLRDETGYISRLIDIALDEGVAIEPTEAATSSFRTLVEAAIPATVWASGCDNWYKGRGQFPVIWPWYDIEHQEMLADLVRDDLSCIPLIAYQEQDS